MDKHIHAGFSIHGASMLLHDMLLHGASMHACTIVVSILCCYTQTTSSAHARSFIGALSSYINGFGDLNREFWLNLNSIHL